MDAWSFLRLRLDAGRTGKEIAGFYVPMGAGVGGAGRGDYRNLDHHGTALAAGCEVDVPRFTCRVAVSGPVRPILFDVVVFWGMVVRFLFENWPVGEHVWATAAIFGAFTGALAAYLSIRVARVRWPRGTASARSAASATG